MAEERGKERGGQREKREEGRKKYKEGTREGLRKMSVRCKESVKKKKKLRRTKGIERRTMRGEKGTWRTRGHEGGKQKRKR